MNKVMLIGNVGQEPEVRYVDQGVAVADKLYIEGRIRYTTYDDKQGQKRYATEIWADNMEMLTPKSNTPTDAAAQPSPAPQAAPDGEQGSSLPF